jgi:hypothetical protein
MNDEETLQQLLRWRLERAAAGAPPAPRAARLLERARPWWEARPEFGRGLFERLAQIQLAYGHAMVPGGGSPAGYPVPVLHLRAGEEIEASARVLYFNLREGRLRLRFLLEPSGVPPDPSFEVTFVTDDARPLFTAPAVLSTDHEYRIDAVLPETLAAGWAGLRVTDRLPFRFILGPAGV